MPVTQALRPRPAHVALAAGFAVAGCLAGAFYHPAPWRPFDLWAYLLTLLIALSLALRENRPFAVLVVTAAGFAGYLLLGCSGTSPRSTSGSRRWRSSPSPPGRPAPASSAGRRCSRPSSRSAGCAGGCPGRSWPYRR
ncbi:hypothetical protein ACWD4Z_00410 [Streptomyces antibioticus]